ncbi:capreomycidine synthase [Streptomyces sp. WI04-05B]|uniref:capreomycidine synthase n=1 Tax=Streptomyces TaxID=1883 RepID=UPI0029AE4BFC|nr:MULTISPECIES: capreomycidine synthase [unclassified Streptomyces]MDX2547626.1 capreomycidine synthase [Streptomyces sp. WI04-05B]MDX2590118.1 capreomycidine synthase [Streptomyces sp. WI04-05A]
MSLAEIRASSLEDWLRDRYFTARIDISSSGVEGYSLGDLRRELDITVEALDAVPLRDSPSLGSDELRSAVADRYGGSASKVMVTHGSTEGIFLALSALVRPGDEVVVLSPVYASLSAITEAIGARLHVWELDADDGFRPGLDRLRSLLTPLTRAVVVNFPHNPTGVSLDRETFEELVRAVAANGSYLIWDGAFAELAHDRPALPDPTLTYERAVSFGTLSKAFGLPGLRVGWCTGSPEVLDRMVRLRDYVTLNTSPVTELLATAVLSQADRIIAPRRAQALHNRELLGEWVDSHSDLVTWRRPDGGVAAFPRILGVATTDDICSELADKHGVLVVPGSCFGHPERIRIGFGGPSGELVAGLDAIASVAAAHSLDRAGR